MWKDRYCSERACRRQLHESLQTLRGNIRVVCRVRPPRNGVNVTALDADQPGSMTVTHPDKDRRSRHFEFNDVLGARSSQADVFEVRERFVGVSVAQGTLNTCAAQSASLPLR